MKTLLYCACAAVAALGFVPGLQRPTDAATTVLAIGDSITKGEGSFDTGGYRMFLDQMLGPEFQFIGKRRDENQPDRGDWQYHNGYGGYQASSLTKPDKSIHKRFVDDNIFAKIGRPDVILLHVGTNTIGYADPRSSSESYAGSTSDKADVQLYRFLDYLGKACPNTKIIVAQIIPKVNSDRTLADTWKYNFGGTDGKGGIPGVLRKISSSISSRVTLANMFQIDLRAIGKAHLIGDSRVDPDGDGVVDWVKNFDEYNFHSSWGMKGYNPNLLVDPAHPTRLGYELMAAQWRLAMQAAGIVPRVQPTKLGVRPAVAGPGADEADPAVVPSPSAAAAGIALAAAALLKRRRAA